jgi:hypothetical protein
VITSVKRDSKKALGFPPTARRSPAYLYDNLKIRLTDYVNCVKHKLQEIIFFDGLFSNRLLCTWLPPQPATSNQQPQTHFRPFGLWPQSQATRFANGRRPSKPIFKKRE